MRADLCKIQFKITQNDIFWLILLYFFILYKLIIQKTSGVILFFTKIDTMRILIFDVTSACVTILKFQYEDVQYFYKL